MMPERIPSPFRDSPHVDNDVFQAGLGGGATLHSEIHGELRIDPNRERLRTGAAVVDPFDISDIMKKYAPTRGDPTRGNIEREIDFNWKRYETYGKADYVEQRGYQEQGWRAVQHHHFPGRFAPVGTEGPVIIKDMILMERPMRLTAQARNEEITEATRAMQVHRLKVAETPEGSAPRIVYANRSSREAIPIPDE
jgi:hypothetical protein